MIMFDNLARDLIGKQLLAPQDYFLNRCSGEKWFCWVPCVCKWMGFRSRAVKLMPLVLVLSLFSCCSAHMLALTVSRCSLFTHCPTTPMAASFGNLPSLNSPLTDSSSPLCPKVACFFVVAAGVPKTGMGGGGKMSGQIV